MNEILGELLEQLERIESDVGAALLRGVDQYSDSPSDRFSQGFDSGAESAAELFREKLEEWLRARLIAARLRET